MLARRSLDALNENVSFGSTGLFVELIQQRLAALHFYIPQTGVYDKGTGLALDAYHRLCAGARRRRSTAGTISYLLDGYGQFPVRFPGNGRHAEGNLSLQLLALIDGSHVVAIYPISSGKPSTPTILGNFQVYSRVPGYLPDGMYFSNFFIGGYAIHGYDPAPDYPASHGCMRLPIVDAISVYNWLAIGDWVDTYYYELGPGAPAERRTTRRRRLSGRFAKRATYPSPTPYTSSANTAGNPWSTQALFDLTTAENGDVSVFAAPSMNRRGCE